MAAKSTKAEVSIKRIETTTLEVHVLGTTPFVCNTMSFKAQGDLVGGSVKKNKAQKETTLKHDPMQEFRDSAMRSRGDDAPTRIIFPGGGMKKAFAQAAVDIPGAAKAAIFRLAQVLEYDIPIYGVPQFFMKPVRMQGPSRTPDIRTRAIVPEWASTFHVQIVRPNLTEQNIVDLIASAGVIIGIGDGRPEKGALNMGCFEIVNEDDPRLLRIIEEGGREAQDAAFEKPAMFDHDTEQLWRWFLEEAVRREVKITL